MIRNINDLKFYLLQDKLALGVRKSYPSFWKDNIWKIEILLRVAEYFENTKRNSFIKKIIARVVRTVFEHKCTKRCCEIPLNVIGPGLCIWHGYNIIINNKAKIGSNFGISANCNVGHAHNKVPVIGNNVTMCYGSSILGGILVCDNVTIGAKSLVLKNIEIEYSTWGGIPAKIISKKSSNMPMMRG